MFHSETYLLTAALESNTDAACLDIQGANQLCFFSVAAGSEREPPQDLQGSASEAMEHRGAGKAKRLATFISGLVECMFFAGVIFGWASLVYVLKDLDYFRHLCIFSAVNQTTNATGTVREEEWVRLTFKLSFSGFVFVWCVCGGLTESHEDQLYWPVVSTKLNEILHLHSMVCQGSEPPPFVCRSRKAAKFKGFMKGPRGLPYMSSGLCMFSLANHKCSGLASW